MPKRMRCWRVMRVMATGAVLLQAGGCTLNELNEFIQTVFLGVSAAGAYAILQNI